jgi:aryl-alcohol dehydrogenase-like predicted oxidoreductase
MDYTQLGRTGLKVSRLCLGTMNFGPKITEQVSFAIMDKAHDLGIDFFDTTNTYGWKLDKGWTEQIVGRWFVQGGRRREKAVIATKVYGRMGEWPNQSRLSALHIRQAVDGSLRCLQTDHIDLYQVHHVDRNTPWEEIWRAIETLVQQLTGSVRASKIEFSKADMAELDAIWPGPGGEAPEAFAW